MPVCAGEDSAARPQRSVQVEARRHYLDARTALLQFLSLHTGCRGTGETVPCEKEVCIPETTRVSRAHTALRHWKERGLQGAPLRSQRSANLIADELLCLLAQRDNLTQVVVTE